MGRTTQRTMSDIRQALDAQRGETGRWAKRAALAEEALEKARRHFTEQEAEINTLGSDLEQSVKDYQGAVAASAAKNAEITKLQRAQASAEERLQAANAYWLTRYTNLETERNALRGQIAAAELLASQKQSLIDELAEDGCYCEEDELRISHACLPCRAKVLSRQWIDATNEKIDAMVQAAEEQASDAEALSDKSDFTLSEGG